MKITWVLRKIKPYGANRGTIKTFIEQFLSNPKPPPSLWPQLESRYHQQRHQFERPLHQDQYP